MVLITKGSKVTNTTESFNCNFKCILISEIGNMLYEATLDGNELFLHETAVICGFLGFIDNLELLFIYNTYFIKETKYLYKRNKNAV